MKRILSAGAALLLLCALLCAAVGTEPDITMSGSVQQLSSTSTIVRWVTIIAAPGNSASVRVGDYRVSTSRGAQVAAGAGLHLPASGQFYDLSTIYVLGTSGDKVSIVWGN